MKNPRKTKTGQVLLNLGCGGVFSPEWNNIDLYRSKEVFYHNLENGIPFSDNCSDVVYSSHVLEHFSREKGNFFIKEIFRVLKPGGMVRLVLPDLETIAAEYLKNIVNFRHEPSERNWQRYHWSVLELYDQTVREQSGGEMLKALRAGDVDWEYILSRAGDEFYDFYPWNKVQAKALKTRLSLWQRLFNRLKSVFRSKDPKKIGELHRWMYDEVSLTHMLENCGFVEIFRMDWNESRIAGFEKYGLDASKNRSKQRKPDSFYLEAKKP
ncbi:TPA: methyltransferase [Patescibacteria group bacterium]|nr:methyltransferase [Patescibacteria group bacterium]